MPHFMRFSRVVTTASMGKPSWVRATRVNLIMMGGPHVMTITPSGAGLSSSSTEGTKPTLSSHSGVSPPGSTVKSGDTLFS